MMKRTRVDEVQYGTRPGPGGVGGSGGGGGAVSTGSVSVGTSGGVSIGTVVAATHGATGGGATTIGVGLANSLTAGAIAHHRILTPQHGGSQTIAYMPSTTPSAAANLKTTSTIVDNTSNSASSSSSTATVGGGASSITQIGPNAVVSTGNAGIPTQAVQYSTSYSVSSIPTVSSGLKTSTTPDGTVQIHVTTGGGAANIPSTPQSNSIRQRTISGNQSTPTSSNLSTASSQQLLTQTPPSSSQPPPNGPLITSTPQTSATAPRLKVEDALSYLDQVKYQYADQPQIYNNFLDIMKEFKSHCIDTPGVIDRVSTLFKGHTELIYGFNMFLPPGYKIEIHSDELGCSVPVVSMPSPPLTQSSGPPGTGSSSLSVVSNNSMSSASQHQHTIKTTTSITSTPTTSHNAANVGITTQIQAAGVVGGAVNLMTHGGSALSQTTIHALQPGLTSQATSHSQTVASNVVSGQVSVGTATASHLPQNYSRDRERATIAHVGGSTTGTASIAIGPPTPNSLNELSPHAAGAQHNLHHIQQAHQSLLLGETTGQQNQPVEFNHAITYVNKIKNRFQNQPAKYKKFLEILHAYQKEQKVMKEGSMNQGKVLTEQEVYTQVAKLFGQDEDLLREFGQFLPDATNHQATAAQYMAKTQHTTSNDLHKRVTTTPTTGTLSGGAHISMSPSAPPSSGSPLQLSSGATMAQIENSAHAAAIGNLSAVNTSVSIKSYNNSQQNHHHHVINAATTVANANTARNDIIFEKEYHGVSVHPHPHSGGLLSHHGIPSATTTIRSSAYEKDAHRNNHHHAVNQKYVGHNQSVNVSTTGHHQQQHHHHHHNASKKSPSYGSSSLGSGISVLPPHITASSNSSSGLERSVSSNLNYSNQGLSSSHQNISGSRRQLDDSGGGSALSGAPPAKRHKPICRDISFSEASRKCTISDAAFFDKVRKALRNPEVYDNFLRCLTLFNQEIVSKTELLGLISPFLMKFPDLLRWFTDFLGPSVGHIGGGSSSSGAPHIDGMPLHATQRQSSSSSGALERQSSSHQAGVGGGEYAQEIDLASCKRLGASYCALPQTSVPKKCSGRTALCREVLNDKWVSFPTWASEDSTFVTSRKTQFEETIYRTEDERFELDLVIEVNSATIRVLEGLQKKMSRMSPEELIRFHLDDYLGGTSQTIHQRAINRIYGEKACEIIQGLKKNPSIAVPIILKRLRVKEEEWRAAQKTFNKQWREQNEKYYLKSLDHQAINFKPNDMKSLRSKSLYNDIETAYDERHDQEDDNGEPLTGPHLVLPYKDKTIMEDAANLLIHHVKRQTGIQKQEKTKIKHILRQFVPDLFFTSRQPLSDDERDDDDNDKMEVDSTSAMTSHHAEATTSTAAMALTAAKSSNKGTTTTLSFLNISPLRSSIKTEMAGDPTMTGSMTTTSLTDSIRSTPASAVPSAIDSKISSSIILTEATTTSNVDDIKIEIKQEKDNDNNRNRPQHAISNNAEEAYTLFFANNSWYLFFRLHAILCERLRTMYERARILTLEEEKSRINRRETTATALRLKPRPEIQVEDYYPTFLDMLKSVLDGNMDSNTFEDSMREMFGIHAYISFTLDKVVSNAVRQLQNCVTERVALDCIELFAQEQRRGATGGLCRDANRTYEREMSYQRKAESSLSDENCFKVFIYKVDCRITIELLDSETEEVEKPVNKVKSWNKYVDRLVNPGTTGSSSSSSITNVMAANNENIIDITELKAENPEEEALLSSIPRKPRFLKRNKRKSCLMEDHLRQLFEQRNNVNLAAAAPSATVTTSSSTAAAATTTSPTKSCVTVTTTNNTAINKSPSGGGGGSGGRGSSGGVEVPTKSNATATERTANANNNNNNTAAAVTFWTVKRLADRVGAQSGGGIVDKYVFNDRDEITVNAIAGRCFVTSKNLKFFKCDAVRRAKISHLRVTQRKFGRFQKFQTRWLAEHVSLEQQQQCNDWLLGRTVEMPNATVNNSWLVAPKTKAILQNDMKKTPYRIFNRYKVFANGTVATTAAATMTTSVASAATNTAGSISSGANIGCVSSNGGGASGNSSSGGSNNAKDATPTHCSNAANTETLQQVRPMES